MLKPQRPVTSSIQAIAAADRRNFITKTSAATAGLLAMGVGVHTQASEATTKSANETIRLGLIGAGGRGSGAAIDSLSINENVMLAAIADFEEKKIGNVVKGLSRQCEGKVDVPTDKMYGGIDAYRRMLDDPSIDIVLLATPPGFRPSHLGEAIDAGKHVFAEKPTCVDAAGYHSCLKTHDAAIEKKLSIVTGTQYRRQENYVEAIRRIHAGEIGEVISATSRYCSNGIWFKNRKPDMSDIEYQIYNWMHFIWLSGDQIVEQSVHNIDLMNWLMQSPPETAFGGGGRFTRPEGSELWDSMAVDYRYPGNKLISFMCRQIPDAVSENGTVISGTNGTATILGINGGASIVDHDGVETWSMKGDINKAYQQEHKDLVDSVRSGQPIVELAETATSSYTAVMGRTAAYTAQNVTWKFMTEDSKLDLFPQPFDIKGEHKSAHAIPGQTKLV